VHWEGLSQSHRIRHAKNQVISIQNSERVEDHSALGLAAIPVLSFICISHNCNNHSLDASLNVNYALFSPTPLKALKSFMQA
jgi:hypothetical protein